MTIQGDRSLPEDVTAALYRIAQEALNNIAKHAEASQISIWLRSDQTNTELRVSDNGCGFDTGSVPAGHLGLGIMHERAKEIGAEFRIESEPDSGSTGGTVSWPDQPDAR